MSDEIFDRSVDAEAIADEILTLRAAAKAYTDACTAGQSEMIARLGAELERAAVRYTEKRDELNRDPPRNYLAIVEAAERERERSEN